MTEGAPIDDESDAFLDAVLNGQDTQNKRLIRVIDNRFRSHRRRMQGLEEKVTSILPLVNEIKLLRRALVAAPAILGAGVTVAKITGAF